MPYRKKLIEVALPLEAINKESAREKSIRHGHPSTLHLWWARRPLAACRAVLFAQLVDDPSGHPEQFPTEEAQEAERQRLSRQMHDGPAQAMSNFILQTEIAMRLLDADPKQAKDELASLKTAALGTFKKVRNFIFELRTMMLDDLGLVPTIRKYVDAFKEQTSMDVTLMVTGT